MRYPRSVATTSTTSPRGRPQRRSQPAQCWRAPPAGGAPPGPAAVPPPPGGGEVATAPRGDRVTADVGERLRATRPAGARGDPQPRARLVEDDAGAVQVD